MAGEDTERQIGRERVGAFYSKNSGLRVVPNMKCVYLNKLLNV